MLNNWSVLNSTERLNTVQDILTVYHTKKETSHYLEAYRQEEASYWFPLTNILDSLLSKNEKIKVLDVGTAYGTLLLYSVLWGAKGYGIDMIDRYWTKELEDEYGISWSLCNIEAEEIPWSNLFDIIIFTEVLEHMNYNPLPVFKKFNRYLVSGGHILLSTPWSRVFSRKNQIDILDMPYYQTGNSFIDAEFKYYSIDEIIVLALSTGFTINNFNIYNGHILTDLVKV